MPYDHASHSHAVSAAANLPMLVAALAINVAFMALELLRGRGADSASRPPGSPGVA